MRASQSRLVALLLLLLYLVAVVHVVLPAHHDEEPGFQCAFAWLLSSLALGAVALLVAAGWEAKILYPARARRLPRPRPHKVAPRAPPQALLR